MKLSACVFWLSLNDYFNFCCFIDLWLCYCYTWFSTGRFLPLIFAVVLKFYFKCPFLPVQVLNYVKVWRYLGFLPVYHIGLSKFSNFVASQLGRANKHHHTKSVHPLQNYCIYFFFKMIVGGHLGFLNLYFWIAAKVQRANLHHHAK